MRVFEPDGRVFIFGFSRGAYAARALCGMLEMSGLLQPGNEGRFLTPCACLSVGMEGSSRKSAADRTNFESRRTSNGLFAGNASRIFLASGTPLVSSVGWVLDPIGLKPGRLPYTFELEDVSIIRRAVSIDERRAFFRQNLVEQSPVPRLKQVWFAGCALGCRRQLSGGRERIIEDHP